jgi:probable F420-dependent oxidoreductase
MPNPKIGVQLHPQATTVDQLRTAWKAADELGVDSLWVWDHFYPLYGDPDATHFEAYTLLAAMAADTTKAQIGALVTCNSYRNPELLADMSRTIDHISGGRFTLGIGSGWFERDYEEYGYEFGTAGSRLDALAEALPRIEARWGRLNPAPTREIPVLIGGSGEQKTLRLVARHADIWHSFATPEVLDHKLEVLRRWCEVEGRDIAEIEISNEQRSKDLVMADMLRERGVTLFTVGISGPDYDLDIVREWLAWRDQQNA